MSETIHVAMCIGPDGEEYPRKAFETREACGEYIKRGVDGGRVIQLELETNAVETELELDPEVAELLDHDDVDGNRIINGLLELERATQKYGDANNA